MPSRTQLIAYFAFLRFSDSFNFLFLSFCIWCRFEFYLVEHGNGTKFETVLSCGVIELLVLTSGLLGTRQGYTGKHAFSVLIRTSKLWPRLVVLKFVAQLFFSCFHLIFYNLDLL